VGGKVFKHCIAIKKKTQGNITTAVLWKKKSCSVNLYVVHSKDNAVTVMFHFRNVSMFNN